jgi:hypothetical protein
VVQFENGNSLGCIHGQNSITINTNKFLRQQKFLNINTHKYLLDVFKETKHENHLKIMSKKICDNDVLFYKVVS